MNAPGFLKITISWNKRYDIIIPVNDVTNKIWSRDSIYISDIFMWCYKYLTRKTAFFEGWSWFKFKNSKLPLGTNLKLHTSVGKRLKLKVRKIWGANSYLNRSYRGKTDREPFYPHSPLQSWIGLKHGDSKWTSSSNLFNHNMYLK